MKKGKMLLNALLLLFLLLFSQDSKAQSDPVAEARQRIVKIYGAGGIRGLEGYQSGLLVSKDGLVATVDSLVLEEGEALVVLADGSRYSGILKSVDRLTGLALLQLSIEGRSLDAFRLDQESLVEPSLGTVVFALSNAFNIAAGAEPITLQRGMVSAAIGLDSLQAERAFPRLGKAFLTDAITSNPGAAGGAIISHDGQLLGIIGPETESPLTGTWMNYAISVGTLQEAVSRMESGVLNSKPDDLADFETKAVWESDGLRELGILFVPSLTIRTPPYVEHVVDQSPADLVGLQVDDLLLAIDGKQTSNAPQAIQSMLKQWHSGAQLRLSVLREGKVVVLTLANEDTSLSEKP